MRQTAEITQLHPDRELVVPGKSYEKKEVAKLAFAVIGNMKDIREALTRDVGLISPYSPGRAMLVGKVHSTMTKAEMIIAHADNTFEEITVGYRDDSINRIRGLSDILLLAESSEFSDGDLATIKMMAGMVVESIGDYMRAKVA